MGWGAHCDGVPASGYWTESERMWLINRLELGRILGSHASPGASRVDSHRQHVGGIVHKPPGRSTLGSPLQTGSMPFAVGRSPSALHSSSARSGLPEQRRGYAIEGRDSSRRMETEPQDSENDLGTVRKSGGGFVRDRGEHSLPSVLLFVTLTPRRGCTHDDVAECPSVCVPPAEDFVTSAAQNQRR